MLPTNPATEFTLRLSAARAGNLAALGELLSQARNYLLAVAQGELPAELRAKLGGSDLVQESYLEIPRLIERFEGHTPEEFRAWLRGILLNKLADARRRFRRGSKRGIDREQVLITDPSTDPAGELASPSAVLQRAEEEMAMARALAELPELYQQVIRLRTWEGLTFAEVGRRMGRSEDAARMMWGRALQQLRRILEAAP